MAVWEQTNGEKGKKGRNKGEEEKGRKEGGAAHKFSKVVATVFASP